MRFDLNNRKFMIKFYPKNPIFYAELWIFDDDTKYWNCLDVVGKAECSNKDSFDKSKGRKLAIARMFKEMNNFVFEQDAEYTLNTKEWRKKFWEETYFKECKK